MNKDKILNLTKSGLQKISDFIEQDQTQHKIKEGIREFRQSSLVNESKVFIQEIIQSEEAKNFKSSFKKIFTKKEN